MFEEHKTFRHKGQDTIRFEIKGTRKIEKKIALEKKFEKQNMTKISSERLTKSRKKTVY